MSKPTKTATLDAIRNSGGIMSTIAEKLGVTWHTAKSYVDKWPETIQAFEDERNRIVDMAESVLVKSIRNGDTQDAKWLLSRLGKDRGYVERQETTGKDGGPIQTESAEMDLDALTDDERFMLMKLWRKAKKKEES